MTMINKIRAKTLYRVITDEGEFVFKQRKICKAYRRWLRENSIKHKSNFFHK